LPINHLGQQRHISGQSGIKQTQVVLLTGRWRDWRSDERFDNRQSINDTKTNTNVQIDRLGVGAVVGTGVGSTANHGAQSSQREQQTNKQDAVALYSVWAEPKRK
jgi:hypothetical protein